MSEPISDEMETEIRLQVRLKLAQELSRESVTVTVKDLLALIARLDKAEAEREAAISVSEMNATSGAFWAQRGRQAEARAEAAEALMLDLRAYIVTHDDISMHSKAVALSDRVNNHFPKGS